MLGHADVNALPQAVFTSFKLPKPGQSGQPTSAAAVTTPSSAAAELLAMAAAGPDFKFSLGGGSGAGSGVEKVLSAPLGGLPAMASQVRQTLISAVLQSEMLYYTCSKTLSTANSYVL